MRELYLFTTFYKSDDVERNEELLECIRKNANNTFFKNIYVFVEEHTDISDIIDLEKDKTIFIKLDKIPSYKDWLKTSIDLKIDGISIFSNSDIYFDGTLARLYRVLEEPKSFVCITRKEDDGAGTITDYPLGAYGNTDPRWTQDVWAVDMSNTGEINNLISQTDIEIGQPGCDNKIAFVFFLFGWKIFNSFNFINCYHRHTSGIRTYKKFSLSRLGCYALVKPSAELKKPSYVSIHIVPLVCENIAEIKVNDIMEKYSKDVQEISQKKIFYENLIKNKKSDRIR